MKPQQPPHSVEMVLIPAEHTQLGILLEDEEWYSWKRYASSELSGEAFFYGRLEIG